MAQFNGNYRALVVDNVDPERRTRVRVQLPQIMGGSVSGWALPIPATATEIPEIGSQVIVCFEGGDLSQPLYYAETSGSATSTLEYAVGTSAIEAPTEGWSTETPVRTPGHYIWMRSVFSRGDGTSGTSSPVVISGFDGTSPALVRIDSSRGVLFKSNTVSTVLSVTIFRGDMIINNILDLWDVYGPGAYLEWQWQRLDDEDFGTISASDPRIGAGGFTFTLTPEDVDTRVVFRCTVNGGQ